MKKYQWPIIASLLAIAITTTMDFTGYTVFSALPLIVLTLVFWLITKLSKREMGLVFGKGKYYLLALLYPAFVFIPCALLAYISGDFSIGEIKWVNILAGLTIGPIMVLITEEGFFRGFLWGGFKKGGMTEHQTLIVTSIIFMVWHISWVTSDTEFGMSLNWIPIYLGNALLLGINWGMLRIISGSIIVPTVCHAIWNAFAYEFFAFGEKVGALGITNTFLFGPEVGLFGLLFNSLFFLILWRLSKKKEV